MSPRKPAAQHRARGPMCLVPSVRRPTLIEINFCRKRCNAAWARSTTETFLLRMFYDIITTMLVVCLRSTVWGARSGVPVAIVEWSNRPPGSRTRFRFRVGTNLAQPLSNESVPSTHPATTTEA